MFSYVSAEERVPEDHPLRAIRSFVDEILRGMTREFDALYSKHGRPSIPPERLLRAQLLQLFYSIRSERLLMEQLDYNILFRWFVGLEMDEPISGADGVHEEPRSIAAARRRPQSLPACGGSRVRSDVGRALHSGRHTARGVGKSEECSTERR
jgi:transposase